MNGTTLPTAAQAPEPWWFEPVRDLIDILLDDYETAPDRG